VLISRAANPIDNPSMAKHPSIEAAMQRRRPQNGSAYEYLNMRNEYGY
jgi:hypothetical protein